MSDKPDYPAPIPLRETDEDQIAIDVTKVGEE